MHRQPFVVVKSADTRNANETARVSPPGPVSALLVIYEKRFRTSKPANPIPNAINAAGSGTAPGIAKTRFLLTPESSTVETMEIELITSSFVP